MAAFAISGWLTLGRATTSDVQLLRTRGAGAFLAFCTIGVCACASAAVAQQTHDFDGATSGLVHGAGAGVRMRVR